MKAFLAILLFGVMVQMALAKSRVEEEEEEEGEEEEEEEAAAAAAAAVGLSKEAMGEPPSTAGYTRVRATFFTHSLSRSPVRNSFVCVRVLT
nr:unnamed protein product [Spirometra erinaceieuropaei]